MAVELEADQAVHAGPEDDAAQQDGGRKLLPTNAPAGLLVARGSRPAPAPGPSGTAAVVPDQA